MKTIGLTLLTVTLTALTLAACGGNGGSGGDAANGAAGGSAGNPDAAGANQEAGESNGQNGTTDADKGGNPPSSGGKQTIVFSVFWPNKHYEEAAKAYEAAHPNVDIQLKYGLSRPYSDDGGDGGQTDADIEKFTTATNAAMLAGKGPDLLDLRYLAAEDYERHRLLEDLGARMEEDKSFRKSDYFANVLGAGQSGAGPFSIPLTFSLSGLVGDRAAIAATGVKIDDGAWTWDDFMTAGRQLVAAKGKYDSAIVSGEGMMVGGPDYFARGVVADNYGSFVDEAGRKASFDSPAFTGLLERIKAMIDEGVVGSGGRAYFTNVTIQSPTDYLTSLRTFGDDTAFYVKPHADGAGKGASFETGSDIGINAGSKAKDAAWDFLHYMMDHTAIGLPVNKARFRDAVASLKRQGTITPDALGPLKGTPFKVDGAKLDQLEGFAEGAARKKRDSGKVLDIVAADSAAFFAGQKSAEDVAKLIQNKATTVLHE
ncbi:carbohydrate ABC transporter substrate-binding protein, CUT1 family [Paenibacillus sp. UNC496MF]|uniref:ABC transporter substrate-binding protein n=1 Tax=Paenibacillus sp. UNC496MF TaxID=1502753 RepID=UPI0008ED136F|nr:extracellular solute-binding protein [Paenibacillus sp. UNC496MF]SFI27635.1 carbohydrate ABC transporter substrate-binding protein, CUT1 family [Paenibacillus sp. UNC496MF]